MTKITKKELAHEGVRLEPLFDAVWQFRSESEADAVVPTEGRDGEFLGSGDGELTGLVSGSVRWSSWARDCLYPLIRQGQEVPADLHLCTFDTGGIIETHDGARIRFEARSYGLRSPEEYLVTSTVSFGTEDPRYEWLVGTLGVMEGEFNERAGTATWRASVPQGRRP